MESGTDPGWNRKGNVIVGGDRPFDLCFMVPKFFSGVFPTTAIVVLSSAVLLGGCETTTTDQYQASAITTYTWLVDYERQGGGSDRPPRIEKFASTSLENRNGQEPAEAVTGPDDQGLWWPERPPRPTVDELEERQQGQDIIGEPRLQRNVEYQITFRVSGGANRTLPTRYDVYRQVVKAYEDRVPLEFVLDPTESIVTQANRSAN